MELHTNEDENKIFRVFCVFRGLFSKETPVLAHTMQHENKDFRVFRVFRGLFSKEFPCGIPHQRGAKFNRESRESSLILRDSRRLARLAVYFLRR